MNSLALRAVGRDVAPLLGEPGGPGRGLGLQLGGREDMAQHFLISAWLTWQGGQRLTEALGLARIGGALVAQVVPGSAAERALEYMGLGLGPFCMVVRRPRV